MLPHTTCPNACNQDVPCSPKANHHPAGPPQTDPAPAALPPETCVQTSTHAPASQRTWVDGCVCLDDVLQGSQGQVEAAVSQGCKQHTLEPWPQLPQPPPLAPKPDNLKATTPWRASTHLAFHTTYAQCASHTHHNLPFLPQTRHHNHRTPKALLIPQLGPAGLALWASRSGSHHQGRDASPGWGAPSDHTPLFLRAAHTGHPVPYPPGWGSPSDPTPGFL